MEENFYEMENTNEKYSVFQNISISVDPLINATVHYELVERIFPRS